MEGKVYVVGGLTDIHVAIPCHDRGVFLCSKEEDIQEE